MSRTNLGFLFSIIIASSIISVQSIHLSSYAQPVSGDPPCENHLDREERFLDRYEADTDNNGKQQSFQSSFKNGGPCM